VGIGTGRHDHRHLGVVLHQGADDVTDDRGRGHDLEPLGLLLRLRRIGRLRCPVVAGIRTLRDRFRLRRIRRSCGATGGEDEAERGERSERAPPGAVWEMWKHAVTSVR
jgi:hypothetical protein